MNRKEYEDWWRKIEENDGNHVFFDKKVPKHLLDDQEEYLDSKSGCRRGHHSWEVSLTWGDEHDKHKEMYDKGNKYFDAENIPLKCSRCGAWGNAKVEVISEGDLSPDSYE